MPGSDNTTPLDGRPETPNEYAREDVKKYISKFTDRDLLNVVQASQFTTFLPKKPSRDQLIDVATQAILEMYTPSQIKKLINKNTSASTSTTRAVDQAGAKLEGAGTKINTSNIQSPRASMGNQGSAANSLRDGNEDAKGGSGNAIKNMMKKGKDGDFSIDSKLADALPGLKKRVEEILKLYPITEQTRIATVIGVRIKEGDAGQVITTKIANYINFYVALLLGKTKGAHSIPITQAGIDEINKILEMTPFAYLTGKSAPTPAAIKALRKKAEDAKKSMEAMSKNMAARNKQSMFSSKNDMSNSNQKYKKTKIAGHGKKKARATANYFEALNRLINIASAEGKKETNLEFARALAADKNTDLTGIVFDKKKLIDIAESLNISDANTMSGMDPLRIADAIVKAMAAEAQDIQDELVKASKIKNKAERQKAMEAIAEREQNSAATQLANDANEFKQDFSDKIPIVTFDASGEVMSEAVLQAVPVYIVGQSSAGSQFVDDDGNPLSADEVRAALDKKKKDAKNKNIQSSLTGEAGQLTRDLIKDESKTGFFGKIGNFFKHGNDENYVNVERDENGNIINKTYGTSSDEINKEINKTLHVDDKGQVVQQNTAEQKALKQKTPSALVGMGMAPTEEQKQNQEKIYNKAKELQEATQGVSWGNMKQEDVPLTNEEKAAGFRDADDVEGLFDKGRADRAEKTKISALKKEVNTNSRKLFKNKTLKDVQVVYEISNYHEGIFNRLDATNSFLSSLVGITSQIPMLFTGLQTFGMSMNTEGVMAALATVQDIASTAAKVAWMSTGGTVKAGNNKQDETSTILTGDPQTTGRAKDKANPELVSVDWKSKQIKVKPTQQYVTSGTTTGKNKPVKHFATGGTMSAGGTDNGNVTDVKRYTANERNAPMLVNIDSGIVKYSKTFDDVDDDGTKTAIKVYCVNSGINDKVKVGDVEISLMDAVAGLYASVSSIDSKISMNTQLLTSIATTNGTIASNTGTIATNTANSGSDGFSFTSALDSILAGE